MKLGLAALSAFLILAGAGCNRDGAGQPAGDKAARSEISGTGRSSANDNRIAVTPPGNPATGPEPSTTVSNGAPTTAQSVPDFARLYPGATVADPPTIAEGASGPGGMVSFTTSAEPVMVIDFYRDHAEAAGLASVMSMNQGQSRGYGALKQDTGARLQVVATAVPNAKTSVLLTWSVGQ